ncbi:MAG: hypothetical protein ABRQ27_11535 [Clostridiaceae bacterium]
MGEKTLDVIDRLIRSVPVYMLYCNKALKTKTVIYISHKEATLNSCDRIIYM